MTRRAILALAALAALAAGCNELFSGPRYQIAQIDGGSVVRLDTRTGDMRRFVMVLGGDVAAPSQIRTVHDGSAVSDCVELGHVNKDTARDEAAVKAGDTVLYGKSRAGTDEAWAYRCSK
jgi:hypothetical protein